MESGPAEKPPGLLSPPAPNAEGVMVLDQILDVLSAPSHDRQEASRLARLGFLEWLWSLPDGADFAEQAVAAGRHTDSSGKSAPAIAIFRGLLNKASTQPGEPVRRGGMRGRRRPR